MSGKAKKDILDFFPNTKSGKPSKKEQIEETKEEIKILSNPTSGNDSFPSFDEFVDGLGSWKDALKPAWSQKYFKDMYVFLKDEYATKKVYPPPNLIFNAFKLTPVTQIKAVIVGQDPYHQPGQAMGLCFSVPVGIPVPSSLKNIYKSLNTDRALGNFKIPKHGDLTKWALQGVFLLNTVLTVVDSTPNAHAKCGWEKFTTSVIEIINKECNGLVFFLWGAPAQKKAQSVNDNKHCILKTSHPSGLSVNKGFSEAYHFSKCNEYLKKHNKTEIDWVLDP